MERDFKGIWIDKSIWLNEDLTVMEKLFLVEIDSLDNEQGCYASNAHFSEFFQLSKNRCTEVIKSLEKKGFLSVKLEREGRLITKRILKVLGIRKTEQGYSENLDWGIRKTEQGYSENREGNNTNINNTDYIVIIGKEKFSFEDASKLLLENKMNMESAAMQLKIKIETIAKNVPVFLKHIVGIQNHYHNKVDFFSHFKNWLAKQDLKDVDIERELDWFLKMFNRVSGRDFKATEIVRDHFAKQLENGFTGKEMEVAVRNLYHPKNVWHQKTKYENATPEFILTGDRMNKFLNARY